jgi:hypothetical protein
VGLLATGVEVCGVRPCSVIAEEDLAAWYETGLDDSIKTSLVIQIEHNTLFLLGECESSKLAAGQPSRKPLIAMPHQYVVPKGEFEEVHGSRERWQ